MAPRFSPPHANGDLRFRRHHRRSTPSISGRSTLKRSPSSNTGHGSPPSRTCRRRLGPRGRPTASPSLSRRGAWVEMLWRQWRSAAAEGIGGEEAEAEVGRAPSGMGIGRETLAVHPSRSPLFPPT
ncbi:hypothetical protein BRADI_3g27046v3 [Brachypodium distachyon]|uniref:Uncharacterized protein n=1 Tax=Brachypodium distachyon TaxID=15368 RepID=A0A2K2CZF1_BRADI|nr:hypothetical protein BRADI_3g27046v3 [Brachypodium distachyon]